MSEPSGPLYRAECRIAQLEAALRYWMPDENDGLAFASEEYERWVADMQLLDGSPAETDCAHDWKDGSNAVIQSGEFCIKCGAVRAGNNEKIGTKHG